MNNISTKVLLKNHFKVDDFSVLLERLRPIELPEMDKDDKQKVKTATIERSKKVQELTSQIEEMVESICKSKNKMTYTQLRTIYGVVKNKEYEKEEGIGDFGFVIPKLAYIEARQENDITKQYVGFIRGLASEVKTVNDYQIFMKIMEAIVAYHKLYS